MISCESKYEHHHWEGSLICQCGEELWIDGEGNQPIKIKDIPALLTDLRRQLEEAYELIGDLWHQPQYYKCPSCGGISHSDNCLLVKLGMAKAGEILG